MELRRWNYGDGLVDGIMDRGGEVDIAMRIEMNDRSSISLNAV